MSKEAMGNLQNFHKNATLKVATLSFISSHLTTKQEREDLARIFKQIDKKNYIIWSYKINLNSSFCRPGQSIHDGRCGSLKAG